MKDAILIADFGTSNVRAVLFSIEDGSVIAQHSRKYTTLSPKPTFLELMPDEVFSLSEECVRQVVEATKGEVSIKALNFSFIGASLFPLDENFEPSYNCILCFDPRAVDIAEKMQAKYASPIYKFSVWAPAAKIIWLRENEPEAYANTRYFWSIQQYILYRLGLEPVWDPTMANLHYMYNQNTSDWYDDIFEYVGVPREMVATERMLAPDESVGTLTNYGSVDLGAEIPVGVGAHDGDLGMLGLGLLGESGNVIAEVSGTFDHIGFIADKDPGRKFTVRWKPGPLADTIVLMVGFPTYGADVEWFMNTFCGGASDEAYKDLWDNVTFDGQPSKIEVNPSFSGDGMFKGIDLTTTKYDLFKALIEALTFETRRSVDTVLENKIGSADCIRIGGGPSKSDEWSQLRATVTGKTVERIESSDSSALGAAVLICLGGGIYKDLPEAVDHMITIRDSFSPDPELGKLYDERYAEYCEKFPRTPE